MIENTYSRLSSFSGVCVGGLTSGFVIMMCGPDFQILTHFQEKGGPMFVEFDFPKFSPWFFTWFSAELIHVSAFWGVKIDPCLQIFCVKSSHLGGKSLYILHMWSSSPNGPLGSSFRGTQIILISSIYGMHLYGNFAAKLWKKKCWKGAPFWKGNLSWNTRVKVPLSPGAGAGLSTLSP